MEIHLCSLSLGHNSSPASGGGRQGDHFATCRLTCRCCASRDAVKWLLISDHPPPHRPPTLHHLLVPLVEALAPALRAATCPKFSIFMIQMFNWSENEVIVRIDLHSVTLLL